VKPINIHISSIVLVTASLAFIGFLYLSQPKTLAEVSTKSSVAIGTYATDKAEFDRGLELFRKDDLIGARTAFERADPERRDANTQFYIAYSYYRQGWGRVSSDDTLFKPGLDAVERVIALDPTYRSSDASLTMRTPSELKNELEEGLKITPSDLDPLKLFRERK